MTYEDFKHLAEHPQHRDVPAIFKLEVLETEELEEKKQKEQDEQDRIYKQAHDGSIRNKELLQKSEKCGCFNCGRIFLPSEITDYVSDEEPTALCPYCHIDSVIGDAVGVTITPKFLKAMNKRWF